MRAVEHYGIATRALAQLAGMCAPDSDGVPDSTVAAVGSLAAAHMLGALVMLYALPGGDTDDFTEWREARNAGSVVPS